MTNEHLALLIEDLGSQFKVFGEGLLSVKSEVTQLHNKIDTLSEKVDFNSFQVRTLSEQMGPVAKR